MNADLGCPVDFDYAAKRPVTYDVQPPFGGTYQQCMGHCTRNYAEYKDESSLQWCAVDCHMQQSHDPYAFLTQLRKGE